MGVHTGTHRRLTRCPVSSFGFGPHYRLPAFWLQAQEVKNRMCTEWPRLVLDYWGGKCSEPQSASEHATSTSRQNCVQIQYLNPRRLKPVARAENNPRAPRSSVDPSALVLRSSCDRGSNGVLSLVILFLHFRRAVYSVLGQSREPAHFRSDWLTRLVLGLFAVCTVCWFMTNLHAHMYAHTHTHTHLQWKLSEYAPFLSMAVWESFLTSGGKPGCCTRIRILLSRRHIQEEQGRKDPTQGTRDFPFVENSSQST